MSDDRELVAQSAAELLQHLGGLKHARAVRDGWPKVDRAAWKAMADAGWIGTLVPESAGGSGMDALDACALLEAAGEWLAPEPLAAAIAAATALANHAVLPSVLSGERLVLPALDAYDGEAAVRAQGKGDALVLDGTIANVVDGHWATDFLVPARIGDETVLALVAANAKGVAYAPVATVDGGGVGELRLERAPALLVATGDAARVALGTLADLSSLGRAALLSGLMRRALAMTVEYLKTRQQFGRPIGANQVLQHRAATAQVEVTVTGALVREGWRAVGTARQRVGASAAAARASAAAMRVTKECIQLHGAIGFTDEYDIGLFLRRAMALAGACGGEDANLSRYAAG